MILFGLLTVFLHLWSDTKINPTSPLDKPKKIFNKINKNFEPVFRSLFWTMQTCAYLIRYFRALKNNKKYLQL